ncbi:MAG: ABC transporter permease subunit, partial [Acetobacterales bacterium]
IPPFVYLVPIVMLFGVGMVPGVIATIIFALPPIIRLTNLGIRQVQEDLVEAAYAFGSTPRQVLWEIQVPLALRTIMAGLNQTLMLALSMVVIAALIGAGGLGLIVYTGLGRLDVGAAMEGGIGIVLIAIILDRITQALGQTSPTRRPSLLQTMKSLLRVTAPDTRNDRSVAAGGRKAPG